MTPFKTTENTEHTEKKRSFSVRSVFSVVILLFCCIQSVITANEDRLREAHQLFEANEFERSLEIYRTLLGTSLTPWQQAVVNYNIGCTLLAQGYTTLAVQQFLSLPMSRDPNYLIPRRGQTNMAIGLYRQASRFTPINLNQLENNLFDVQEAMSALTAAIDANCRLTKAEGGESCSIAPDLLELKRQIKIHMADLVSMIKPLLEEEISPSDGIPYLMISLKQLMDMIHILDSKSLNDNLKKRYVELGVKKALGWQPLWVHLRERFNQQSEEHRNMFTEAFNHFQLGFQSLKEGAFKQAQSSWEKSVNRLEVLMKKWIGASLTKELLQKLLAFYHFAYAQIPLQESTILALQVEQKNVTERLPEDIRSEMVNAQNALERTVDALHANDSRKGRFYLEIARFEVFLLLGKQEDVKQPAGILKNLVAFQQHALTLNRLRHLSDQGQEEEYSTLVVEAQQMAVKLGETFLPAVIAWQEVAFKSSCQFHPWDEVIPLFNQGLLSAQQSVSVDHPNALIYQEEALAKFQKALLSLQKPPAAFSGTCFDQDAPAQQEKATKPEPKPQPNLKQVLHDILEMDEDDRLPMQEPTIQKGGIRPW